MLSERSVVGNPAKAVISINVSELLSIVPPACRLGYGQLQASMPTPEFLK